VTLDGSARAVAGAVAAVKQDRLWQRHLQIAEIGATGRGGVNRQALTLEDAEARRRVLAWAAACGFEPSVVSSIQGLRWFRVEVTGQEAHAGTTPRARRRDALTAAVDMVRALRDLMLDTTDTARFTVGRFEVHPNSPNTVPGRVLFTIDFRHPDGTLLTRLGDEVAAVCRAHAGGCAVDVIETLNSPPTEFDHRICELIQAAAERQGLPHMRIVSGATHDAKYMAGLCPTGMIFVPCERGISHNEGERASAADLAAGARLLAEVMLRLD